MAHQKVQEDGLWPSVVITLGPCWHKVKLNWANIANGSSTIGFYNTRKCILILMLYIVVPTIA